MKKVLTAAFLILLFCSLMLVGIANAGNAVYSITEYWAQASKTIDGAWTSDTEWTDGPTNAMSNDASYIYVMDASGGTGFYMMDFLVEFFGDNTTDAGDYWQICLGNANSGGTAPRTDCYKIEIVGHTELSFYQGTGSGWNNITTAGELEWANSLSDSPTNSTPHWILELEDNKEAGLITIGAPANELRVAAYDANTSTLAAWPPNSDPDVPNEWGLIADYSSEPYVPEGFSLGIVVLLSSVAVAVSFYFMRKRPKTTSYSSGKISCISKTCKHHSTPFFSISLTSKRFGQLQHPSITCSFQAFRKQ